MTEAEFDRIAEVYDETRRPLDFDALKGLRKAFAAHKCTSMLEIGVGTGRVSIPLMGEGIAVTGVDISRRMMERAREKGLPNLVLADGKRTPFRDRSFDATLLAHVFHLIDDPGAVLREGARVSRVGVFALIRKRDEGRAWFPFGPEDTGLGEEERTRLLEEARGRFREIAEKYHWSWDRTRFRNWEKERDLLVTEPPDELQVVSDVLVTETLEERITRFQKGGYGFMTEMPPEMRGEIIEEMRRRASMMGTGPRHEVHQLAFWRSERILRYEARRNAPA